jgi:hypothetical protein
MSHFHQGAADFNWAIWGARSLLRGENPYARPGQLYPLTAMLWGLPFVRLAPELAAGIFFGGSSFFMALALTRDGYHRLFVFLAYPYWAAILTTQWTPLILASAYYPLLLPATVSKPQIGLPVLVTRPTRTGWLACAVWFAASLLYLPRWPWLWIHHLGSYDHFIPLLVFPGLLLALALLRFRDSDARLLLLAALMPQRWFYDTLILWLIPKSRRHILFTAALSWGCGILRWYRSPHSFVEVGRWTVLFIYLPMLGLVLLQNNMRQPPSAPTSGV